MFADSRLPSVALHHRHGRVSPALRSLSLTDEIQHFFSPVELKAVGGVQKSCMVVKIHSRACSESASRLSWFTFNPDLFIYLFFPHNSFIDFFCDLVIVVGLSPSPWTIKSKPLPLLEVLKFSKWHLKSNCILLNKTPGLILILSLSLFIMLSV